MKLLIIGATGMLGHKLLDYFSRNSSYEISGTIRSMEGLESFFTSNKTTIFSNVDADDIDELEKIIVLQEPSVVINCIGIIKQLELASDPLASISINALFPHKLAQICAKHSVRMIHISTDCVFDGEKGNYVESDHSNATDLYGRTKYLGEVSYGHCVTLRTSIIGHELKGKFGLVEWFLSQEMKIRGFTRAIYTGFPTIELARIIDEYVVPNESLAGLYHVSSEPISKFDLLKLISKRYSKDIEIEPFDDFVCDRSLDSSTLKGQTGFKSASWETMVDDMHRDYMTSKYYHIELFCNLNISKE